jgi:uncharacterized protein, YfiH family
MQQQYLTPLWPTPSNVIALTTLRGTTMAQLVLPTVPAWLKQVHGNKVVCADHFTNELPEADAAIAFTTHTICAVRTADCLPILICDRAGTQVAAIHAGWRSLAAGIISNTCKQFTSAMQDCLVWLGPAIGPSAFEVGYDVLEAFAAYGWEQQEIAVAFSAQPHAKWLGNLYYLARIELQKQGIIADNIYGGEWCTHSDPQRFYSYRRSKDAERMTSLIYLK